VPTRLTVELVPSTCWYTNVRSNVSKAVWDRLRRRVAAEAKVQRLEQLVALFYGLNAADRASD
jgi:hypothetical protein